MMSHPADKHDEVRLDWIDDVADRFEAAWPERPAIGPFLVGADPAGKLPLLVELIKVDLECRWRAGEQPRLEAYFEEFPALDELDQAARDDLIRHADRVARQAGSKPSVSRPPAALYCPRCGERVGGAAPPASLACAACGEQLRVDPPSNENQPPQSILGKFELIEVVGTGSFGRVYRARDVELGRTVALKVPRSGSFAAEEDELRFLREARSASRLDHPGIVKVHDIGHEGDTPFIVCDFIEGETLATVLQSRRFSARESAELTARIAEALDYAHRQNVVHRDIKPTNILIDRDGLPRITDFGLARQDQCETILTLDGQVLGTPAYMSPEQARGASARVDCRSDIYSLGVILYEMLTRERPFRGSLQVVLRQVLEDEPLPIRNLSDRVPRDLETICLKAMNKSPERRYASAADLAADLRRFLRGVPVVARPVSRMAKLLLWSRRNPVLASQACLVAALLIVIAAVAVWSRNEIARSAERTQEQLSISLAERGTQLLDHGNPNGLFDLLASLEAVGDNPRQRSSRVALTDAWSQSLDGLLLHVFGHESPIRAVAISPNGRSLATAADDRKVRLWRASDGELLNEFTLADQRTYSFEIEFNDGGTMLAACTGQWTRVWDVGSGQLKLDQPGLAATFGPGGNLTVVSRIPPRALMVWDVESGKLLQRFGEEIGIGQLVAYSSGRRYLAFTCQDGKRARVLRTKDWSVALQVEHKDAIDAITFSPDESCLATGAWDQVARLWHIETGKQIGADMWHEEDVRDVAFSTDGKRLATASLDGHIRVWDAATGQLTRSMTQNGIPVEYVRFRPADSQTLAAVHRDSAVRLWNVVEGAPRGWQLRHQQKITAIDFSSDGQRVLTGSVDGTARLWDLRERDAGETLPLGDRVWSVDFSSDSQRLATLSERGELWIWKRTAGHWERDQRIPCPDAQTTSLEFGPNENRLAIGVKGEIWNWDLDQRALSAPPSKNLHLIQFRSVAADPRGEFLAGGGENAGVMLFNIRDGWHKRLPHPQDIPLRYKYVWDLEFHPTRPWLATAFEDGIVRIWNTDRGELVDQLPHGDAVVALAFSNDGRLLATAPNNQPVRIWQLDGKTWRVARNLTGLFADVQALDFSPDGCMLATASDNGEVRLWDVDTGLACGRAYDASPYAAAVRFSPDGHWLAAGSFNNTARVWQLDPPTRGSTRQDLQLRVRQVTGARRQDGLIQAIPWKEWRAR